MINFRNTLGSCTAQITVIFRVRIRIRVRVGVRVRVRLGIGLGLGFSSGQSQCVPPFRSVNYHILVKSGTRRSRSVPPFRKLYQPTKCALHQRRHTQWARLLYSTLGVMTLFQRNSVLVYKTIVKTVYSVCFLSNFLNECHKNLKQDNLFHQHKFIPPTKTRTSCERRSKIEKLRIFRLWASKPTPSLSNNL